MNARFAVQVAESSKHAHHKIETALQAGYTRCSTSEHHTTSNFFNISQHFSKTTEYQESILNYICKTFFVNLGCFSQTKIMDPDETNNRQSPFCECCQYHQRELRIPNEEITKEEFSEEGGILQGLQQIPCKSLHLIYKMKFTGKLEFFLDIYCLVEI